MVAEPAMAADWRTCTVGGCVNGECASDQGMIIVASAIDVENPAVGGADGAVQKMQEYYLAKANGTVDQGPLARCSNSLESEDAANAMAMHVYEVMRGGHTRGSVDMEPANRVFAGYEDAAAPSSDESNGDTAEAASAEPEKAAEAPRETPAKSEGNGDPMNFLMWVDMREPINGENSVCFSDIKMKPAPEDYRGNWPSLKNALPIIQGYFPLMLQECSKHGTPVSQNVSFATDDVSPAQKRQTMHDDVERWRKKGFPEVFIPN